VENDRFRAPLPEKKIAELRTAQGLDDRPTLTFVGRITEEKGLDVLLRASARVEAAHQIVVAGTGPLLHATRDLASSLGISERLRFVGHVDQLALPVLLRASDVLVLPSISTKRSKEPWGLVVNEAMNCGLPVIASDAVGAAAGGLLVDHETGLVTPERDVAALAFAIHELAVDEAKRRELGEHASARVLAWNYATAADGFDAALAAAEAENARRA
jgi:glycosyltransferase involved in cell wall biosynthesis